MLTKLKLFIKNNPRAVIIGGPIVLIVLLVGTVGVFRYFFSDTREPVITIPTPEEPEEPAMLASLLNGVMVEPELANRRVVAAMIENSPNARPQTGLASADMVYEGVVEGGITRFMALYQQTQPGKSGPIRSARSNYIDWLSEFDAIYVHAGGSATAMARIGEYGIKSFPHNNNRADYWREPRAGVSSEHTLFANISSIFQNAVASRGWSATHDFDSWRFKEPASGVELGGTLNVNFSSPGFNTRWEYNKETGLYTRFMAGSPHSDGVTGQQITASTVIVMNVNRTSNPPLPGGRQSEWSMQTIGSGSASLFFDGKQVRATWKKPSRTERTRFYDEADREITMNSGQIWVQVLPQTGSYTWVPEAPPPAV